MGRAQLRAAASPPEELHPRPLREERGEGSGGGAISVLHVVISDL